jgi:thioesterase domain-containing protein
MAAEAPLVLLGHSTGGLYAHAVAERCEVLGTPIAAVVMIDSPKFDMSMKEGMVKSISEAVLASDEEGGTVSTTRLTAMGAHLRLLAEWSPGEVAAPTLFVRASEPIQGTGPDSDWKFAWDLDHEIEVPGNHFSMMQQHIETTVQAIDGWLVEILDDVSQNERP